jgi:carbon storage regulator
MLVLTRKIGEAVIMPSCDLTLTVLAVNGSRVQLGLVAPPQVAIRREEALRRLIVPATEQKSQEAS